MKYLVTQPWIAFDKEPQPGDVVELTDVQAQALHEHDCIEPYETKAPLKPKKKAAKKRKATKKK